MWYTETIFSIGDLCGTNEEVLYDDFIERVHEGDYMDRLEHVENMITRLQYEKKILEERFSIDHIKTGGVKK